MKENVKVNQIENSNKETNVENLEADSLIETLWTIRQRVNCFA